MRGLTLEETGAWSLLMAQISDADAGGLIRTSAEDLAVLWMTTAGRARELLDRLSRPTYGVVEYEEAGGVLSILSRRIRREDAEAEDERQRSILRRSQGGCPAGKGPVTNGQPESDRRSTRKRPAVNQDVTGGQPPSDQLRARDQNQNQNQSQSQRTETDNRGVFFENPRPVGTGPPPQKKPAQASIAIPKADVDAVIGHYRLKFPRRRPGARERKKIRTRLQEGYTPADLVEAIDGCLVSEFHVRDGHNSLELIVRDSQHVDQFRAKLDRARQPKLSPHSEGIMRAIQDYAGGGDNGQT